MCSAWNERDRLEGERIALRAPSPQDAARLAAVAADFEIARNLGRMLHPYGLADAEAFLGRVLATHEAGEAQRGWGAFAIEHPEHGLIGMVGFHREPGGLWPEFGYWIGKEHWGKGYATEAANLALQRARACGMRAARAGHFVDNPASGRVLEKAGFLYTGDVEPRDCLARGAPQPTRLMAWLA